MSILVVGSLNTDLIMTAPRLPRSGESLMATSFATAPGGKGANQAVACARLARDTRTRVAMMGAVGADPFAPPLLAALHASGVDTTRVSTSAGGENTGTAVVLVDAASGDNRILVHPGANAAVRPSRFPDDFFSAGTDTSSGTGTGVGKGQWSAVVVQLEIPLATVLHVLRLARAAGVVTVFNPAPAHPSVPDEACASADWCVVNETEAALLTGVPAEQLERAAGVERAAEALLRRGCGTVVVTLGARGCYWSDGGGGGGGAHGHGWVEAVLPDGEAVVDTTGAGDTFVGALAVAVVEGGRDKAECVRFASRAAGRAVTRPGAMAGVPWREEL